MSLNNFYHLPFRENKNNNIERVDKSKHRQRKFYICEFRSFGDACGTTFVRIFFGIFVHFFTRFANSRNSTIANAQHMTFYMFACAIEYEIPFFPPFTVQVKAKKNINQIVATRKCSKVLCYFFCCHTLNIYQINTTFSTGTFATCACLWCVCVCAWGCLRKWIDNKLLTIH